MRSKTDAASTNLIFSAQYVCTTWAQRVVTVGTEYRVAHKMCAANHSLTRIVATAPSISTPTAYVLTTAYTQPQTSFSTPLSAWFSPLSTGPITMTTTYIN